MESIMSWLYEFFLFGLQSGVCGIIKDIDGLYMEYFNNALSSTVTSVTAGSALYPYIDRLVSSILWIQQGLTVITVVGLLVFALFFFHQVFKLIFAFMKALLNIQF